MPESASAVSQLTEEEHSWGKQMKGAERKRGCRGEDGRETKRELREKPAQRKMLQDGWCQEAVEAGSWHRRFPSKDMKSCGQSGGQSEHGMWYKPQMVTLEHWQKKILACKISAAASYCSRSADCWLEEFHSLPRIRRRSIVTKSPSLQAQEDCDQDYSKLVLLALYNFIHAGKVILELSQTLQSCVHCLYSVPEFFAQAHTKLQGIQSSSERRITDKNEECIWISKELSGLSLRTSPNCVNCSSLSQQL